MESTDLNLSSNEILNHFFPFFMPQSKGQINNFQLEAAAYSDAHVVVEVTYKSHVFLIDRSKEVFLVLYSALK